MAATTVTAIDAGVIRLGATPDGVVGAVRATAVTHTPDGNVHVRRYRPGIFALGSSNRLQVFRAMGAGLGREDFYVEMEAGRPLKEKTRLAGHDHRLLDRVRNYVERLVQRSVCLSHGEGIVFFDGALTLRTFDTPGAFLTDLYRRAAAEGTSIVAISKQTGLTVRGVDIRLALEPEPATPARRKLTREMRSRGQARRSLGDLYVARFAPGGETFRVDVAPADGLRSDDVLDAVASSSRFRNGYPEPLVQAHIFSYFTPPLVAELQAYAAAVYGLVPIHEPRLRPIFAPFGGRYK